MGNPTKHLADSEHPIPPSFPSSKTTKTETPCADTQPEVLKFRNDDFHKTQKDPICPLTGSRDIQVLEEIPTSLVIDAFQRDLGINVSAAFQNVPILRLCRCPSSDVVFFFPFVMGSFEFYTQLQTFDWYYQGNKFEYARAQVWVKPGDRVLDIGCGSGQFATYIPTASYTGLEPTPAPVPQTEFSGGKILNETVLTHSLEHSHTYDVVCAFQVLEHMADPRRFLNAALQCLKPGGLLILGVPSASSYITKIPNFVLNAPPHHLTWWTDTALEHLTRQFQLSLLELSHAPVEAWEIRLYWMQRIIGTFLPEGAFHFTISRSIRFLNLLAYMAAGLAPSIAKPPPEAQGASVILAAKKPGLEVSHRTGQRLKDEGA